MLTEDHQALLLQMRDCDNPCYRFLSQNYPPGRMWDHNKVAKMFNELFKANMIKYGNPDDKVEILPSGLAAIDAYLREKDAFDTQASMSYEKMTLEITDLLNKNSDYATTKSRAKWSFIISVITLVIAAIALWKELTKK